MEPRGQPAFILYVQTFGDLVTFNPHIHALVADGAVGDSFGIKVAIDGDIALIGAARDGDNGYSSASAYVFAPDPVIVAIEDLITTVVRSNLQQGIQNALDAKLDRVGQRIDGRYGLAEIGD